MDIDGLPIVVGVDESSASQEAVRWAANLASRQGAPLLLVHGVWAVRAAYGEAAGHGDSLFDRAVAVGQRCLEVAAATAQTVDASLDISSSMPAGAPAPLALVHASENARMVVLGRFGAAHHSASLVGSTAYAVARRAHCPVAVVGGRGEPTALPAAGPVVIGVDSGPTSEPALALAFQQAADLGVALIAVHATPDLGSDAIYESVDFVMPVEEVDRAAARQLAAQLAGWEQKYPRVLVEQRVVHANPRDALIRLSTTAGLVVVGSHGRGGFGRMLLGSTSQALVEHADCPVLVARLGAEIVRTPSETPVRA